MYRNWCNRDPRRPRHATATTQTRKTMPKAFWGYLGVGHMWLIKALAHLASVLYNEWANGTTPAHVIPCSG